MSEHEKAAALADTSIKQELQILDVLAEQNERLEELKAICTKFAEAIPEEGGPDGHRQYHELIMKQMRKREKFMDAVIEKSLAGFIWFCLAGVGSAVWYWIQQHSGIGGGK